MAVGDYIIFTFPSTCFNIQQDTDEYLQIGLNQEPQQPVPVKPSANPLTQLLDAR